MNWLVFEIGLAPLSINNFIFKKFLKKDFIYSFLERGEGKERGRETLMCERNSSIGCLSHAPNQGLGLQPRHMP